MINPLTYPVSKAILDSPGTLCGALNIPKIATIGTL